LAKPIFESRTTYASMLGSLCIILTHTWNDENGTRNACDKTCVCRSWRWTWM